MSLYDAAVIGGGPAGLTAALYLARSGCRTVLVEKLAPGGQVLQTETIENYPGFPQGITGWQLADTFAAHLADLPVDRRNDDVRRLEIREKAPFTLHLGEGSLEAKSVIVCSGAQYRRLGLAREQELVGKGISYCALCDGNFFRGQTVAVVGGGNTALEESLYLSRIAATVHVLHRREKFRGAAVYQRRVQETENIHIHRNTLVQTLHGDDRLEGVTILNTQSGARTFLPLDGLFIFVGSEANGAFLPETLQRDSAGFVLTDTEMRTNIPGLFAAGDIRAKLCRQVVTAVGDGATAAQAAFAYLEQVHA